MNQGHGFVRRWRWDGCAQELNRIYAGLLTGPTGCTHGGTGCVVDSETGDGKRGGGRQWHSGIEQGIEVVFPNRAEFPREGLLLDTATVMSSCNALTSLTLAGIQYSSLRLFTQLLYSICRALNLDTFVRSGIPTPTRGYPLRPGYLFVFAFQPSHPQLSSPPRTNTVVSSSCLIRTLRQPPPHRRHRRRPTFN